MVKSLWVIPFFATLLFFAFVSVFFFFPDAGITGNALLPGDDSTVTRSISGNTVNNDIVVTLSVYLEPGFSHSVYAIEERVDSDFSIISYPGATRSGNVLKWYDIDLTGLSSVDLTYTIRTSVEGPQPFSGDYGIDGMDNEALIRGTNSLTVGPVVVLDTTPPVFYLPSSDPPASYSPTAATILSVSWSDNVGVAERIVETNFSGSLVNETFDGSLSRVLGAGTYRWRSYARDGAGNWAATPVYIFNIPKASPNLVLSLNDESNDISVGVGESFGVATSARKAVNLYADGVLTSPGLKNYSSAGLHNFTAIVVPDSNYSGAYISRFVTVSGVPVVPVIVWDPSRWLAGTTNYSNVDVSNFNGRFVNGFGEIRFLNNLSVSRLLNLSGKVNIGDRFVFVNSSSLPEFNSSAELRFYNIDLVEPYIVKDGDDNGVDCPGCNILSYVSGTLTAEVDSFSTYSLLDAYSPPSDDGDSSGGGGGGGGGGGATQNIPGLPSCVSDYLCGAWSECVDGSNSMICTDVNGCEVDKITTQPCGDAPGATLPETEEGLGGKAWLKIVAVLIVAAAMIGLLLWLWLFKGEQKLDRAASGFFKS